MDSDLGQAQSGNAMATSVRLELGIHHWTWREKIRRGVWILVWRLFGRPGPRLLSPLRICLLRIFGARIGNGCTVCSDVKVLMPWNLEIGDSSVLGERVDVYNYAPVRIGRQTCVSQGSWLCTGTHDHRLMEFPLCWSPITIGDSVWIAAEALVLPGTQIGDGVVVGARTVVGGNLDAWTIYAGNPGRRLGPRTLRGHG